MPVIKRCTPRDLNTLQKISRDIYQETFASLNTEANMSAYLDRSFGLEKLSRELNSETSFFYFVYSDNALAGYLKLNESETQTDIHDPASLEIERIYVASGYKALGIGRSLMEFAVETAKEKGLSYIWLGVWEKNTKAIQFYQKHGFYQSGTHAFVMGDEVQNDYLMRKDLW